MFNQNFQTMTVLIPLLSNNNFSYFFVLLVKCYILILAKSTSDMSARLNKQTLNTKING